MSDMQRMVREFHEAFGHPVSERPVVISMERALLRVKWTKEEIETEFLDAIRDGDLVGAYDAILDGIYFMLGTAVEMGMDVNAGFVIVHRSNMDKLDPDTGLPVPPDPDGKARKREGWEPPEPKLAVILEKQDADGQIYLWARDAANAYLAGQDHAFPPMTPVQMVRVVQGISVILKATDKAAFNRWADEWHAS